MARLRMYDLELAGFAELQLEFLLSSGDSEHLVIEQLFDPQSHLDISSAIASLARSVLLRRQHRELSFPISEHVRLNADEIANLSDLEVNFLRYYCSRCAIAVLKFSVNARPLFYVFIKLVSIRF